MTDFDKFSDGHENDDRSSDQQPQKALDMGQLSIKQTTFNQKALRHSALKPLAMSALGRTGADIERLIREARQKARRQKRKLTYDDIKDALSAGRNSMSEELSWRIAIHEAGHALAMIGFELGTIKTVSVGNGSGGFIESNIRQHSTQEEDWINRMLAFTLAGRAAEVLVLGNAAMGSGGSEKSDLAQATQLALDAETRFGYNTKYPLLYRNVQDQFSILTSDHQLAQQVHTRLEAAEAMANDLLNLNQHVLLRLAKRLVKLKVIDGEEVIELIGKNINTGIP